MIITPTNAAISGQLDRHGRLLEIAGGSPFRRRAFVRAAETIRVLPERLDTIASESRLRDLPGIGEGIAAIIEEILRNGTFAAHDELTAQFPESLLELMAIPGVGAKTVARLHDELGISNMEALEVALTAGSLKDVKGLGTRAETSIRAGVESVRRRTGRIPLGVALPIARAFINGIEGIAGVDRVSLAGSARRWNDTVEDLDIVVATSDPSAVAELIAGLAMVGSTRDRDEHALRVELTGGLECDVYFTNLISWGSTLVRATGDAAHLERLGAIAQAATEEEIYAAHDLPWIPPELRAGATEFERPLDIPSLIKLEDINGEFHSHTTWSDGSAPIREMATAAAQRGYQFLGITDHSHGLGVAGGLDKMRLAAQRLAIAEDDGTDGVRLLAGAEVEVHRDGSLDFDDATLAGLDVVVASLHSGLRQPRDELTSRLIAVLNNPNVDIVAHPSGRLIERREGGDFDWDQVFVAAALTGTALEINADPARLDLDPGRAKAAVEAGCLITINSDAHHPAGFAVMEYGVMVARKAWLIPEQILNCWPQERIVAWLANRGDPA